MQLSLALEPASLLDDMRVRLLARFGPQRDAFRLPPTPQFVNAMISCDTRDEISMSAFALLAKSFPDWNDLADADIADIYALIRNVTRAELAALRLIAAARAIRARRGRFDLSFLAAYGVADAIGWLRRFPGCGAKIAAVTLNFSALRRAVFVVDRHGLRVFTRLGRLPEKADFDRGHLVLNRLIPANWDGDDLYELHWLVKLLSQNVCRPKNPLCDSCPIRDLCERRGA